MNTWNSIDELVYSTSKFNTKENIFIRCCVQTALQISVYDLHCLCVFCVHYAWLEDEF